MDCRLCGAALSDGALFCSICGGKTDDKAGDDTNAAESLGTTKIYVEAPLGRTVIYSPREEREPVFGWLVVTEGNDLWKVFTIGDKEGQFYMGVSQECSLQLTGEGMAALHASLRLKDGKLYLTDLDTSTGTSVNGEVISKTELKDGDEVRMGDTTLKFRKF